MILDHPKATAPTHDLAMVRALRPVLCARVRGSPCFVQMPTENPPSYDLATGCKSRPQPSLQPACSLMPSAPHSRVPCGPEVQRAQDRSAARGTRVPRRRALAAPTYAGVPLPAPRDRRAHRIAAAPGPPRDDLLAGGHAPARDEIRLARCVLCHV